MARFFNDKREQCVNEALAEPDAYDPDSHFTEQFQTEKLLEIIDHNGSHNIVAPTPVRATSSQAHAHQTCLRTRLRQTGGKCSNKLPITELNHEHNTHVTLNRIVQHAWKFCHGRLGYISAGLNLSNHKIWPTAMGDNNFEHNTDTANYTNR